VDPSLPREGHQEVVVEASVDMLGWLRKQLEEANPDLLRERVESAEADHAQRRERECAAEGRSHGHRRFVERGGSWEARGPARCHHRGMDERRVQVRLDGGPDPLVIEPAPRGTDRLRAWLRRRRVFLAAVLAIAEVVAYLIWRPSLLVATLLAVLVFVVCAMAFVRMAPSLGRDLVLVIGLAQALVVVLPIAIGLSFAFALIIALLAIIALAIVAFRLRL
jgi:hypothetical protein